MFRVHVSTPPVVNDDGSRGAGAVLTVGAERAHFMVDLGHWGVRAYERQWKQGLLRLLGGAPSSALMIAYRGPGEGVHQMWGIWREGDDAVIQKHSVVAAELDAPFDPMNPYPHVGARIPVTEQALPMGEWRIDLVHLFATALGLRFPIPRP